jgi:uncharacterized membrane protein YsdA (DUF1294 family)
VIVVGLTGSLFLLLRLPWTWYFVVAVYLIAINLTTFAYYGYDKSRARSTASRVPETVLHGLALFGGTIGAFAGMQLFRHKTIKPAFRLLFWLIVVLQLGLIAALIFRLWKERGG